MDATPKNEGKGGRLPSGGRLFAIAAAVLCAVCVGVMIYALATTGAKTEKFVPPPFESAAQTGTPEMQDGEFFYLLWYVFPEERIPQDELTIKVYDEVLDGRRRVFPRGYFVKCGDVERKARICFKHLCEDVLKLDREGICRTFCNSNGIKVLQKYKLKIILDIVYESLFHLVNATYPEYISDLEKYMYDRRLQSVKVKEASGHAD